MSARPLVLLFALGLTAGTHAAAQKTGERGMGVPAVAPGPTGTRRAVIVGVSKYQYVGLNLQYAAADARDFYDFLRSKAGGSVDTANIRLLLDFDATAGRVYDALKWLLAQSKEGDEAIIYFASHGDVDTSTHKVYGYFLTTDASRGAYLAGGAIEIAKLNDLVQGIAETARVLIITDACRAGRLVGDSKGSLINAATLVQSWKHVIKLASSLQDQASFEGRQWGGGHGAFTYFLIAGLEGLADGADGTNPDKKVSVGELMAYVRLRVGKETADSQTPTSEGDPRLVLAMVDTTTMLAAQIAVANRGAVPAAGRRAAADAPAMDTTLMRELEAFRSAIAAGALLAPAGASAWDVYRRLAAGHVAPGILEGLRGTLAAALQDAAQRVIALYLTGGNLQPGPEELRGAARELARAGELLGPTDPLATSLGARRLFLDGYAAVREERYARALDTLRGSIALEPRAAYAYNALGFAFLGLGRLAEARQAFTNALARAPRWSYPTTGLGLVDAREGRQNEAEANLQQAIAVDSSYMEPRRQLASLYVASSRPKDAERVWREAIARDSTDAASFADLGALLYDRQRYVEAVDVFEHAIRFDSTKIDPQIRLSLSFYYLKRDAAALVVIQRATAMRYANALSWRTLGFLRGQHRDLAAAETAYRRAQQLDPSAAAIGDELGRVYLDAGKLAAADSAFRAALRRDAGYAAAYDGLARVNEARGWATQAEPYYQQAIARDSMNPARHQALASFYFAQGRFSESETAIRRSLALDPRDPWWIKNLGLTLHKLGREKEAEALYLRAITLPIRKR